MATKRTTSRGKRTGERGRSGAETKPAPFAKSTMSGPSVSGNTKARAQPSDAVPPPAVDAAKEARAVRKLEAGEQLAGAIRHNRHKAAEYDRAAATAPVEGEQAEPSDPLATASTTTEDAASAKLGDGEPPAGENPTTGPLQRVRVDSGGQALTTNQGVPVADNQNSLKAGVRGPTLLEDFVLREKITHFDHERIPERVVHARGSGAHGYFECYEPLTEYTRAARSPTAGKRTPVFVRFSTVAGERGSADTVRDVRGFAVKFYTEEGNFDLVGNNIPVFFIQDAMKFPDLVHAVKPEPHHEMPQASSGARHVLGLRLADARVHAHADVGDVRSRDPAQLPHDAGLRRAHLPARERRGRSRRSCKFHWRPLLGTHSLVWDEAVEDRRRGSRLPPPRPVGGDRGRRLPRVRARPADLHRGARPSGFSFDVLDATKIVPEELVPVAAGRQDGARTATPTTSSPRPSRSRSARRTSSRASTSRNDPLLAGPHLLLPRHAADAARRAELPRDPDQRAGRAGPQQPARRLAPSGDHARPRGLRAELARRRLPVPGGLRGFVSFPQPVEGDKVRGKPEKFADHYTQARSSGTARRRSRRRTSSRRSASS